MSMVTFNIAVISPNIELFLPLFRELPDPLAPEENQVLRDLKEKMVPMELMEYKVRVVLTDLVVLQDLKVKR